MVGKIATAPVGVKRLGAVLDEAERVATADPSNDDKHREFIAAKSAYRARVRAPAIKMDRVNVPRDPVRASNMLSNLRYELHCAEREAETMVDLLTARETIDAAAMRELLAVKIDLLRERLRQREIAKRRTEKINAEREQIRAKGIAW